MVYVQFCINETYVHNSWEMTNAKNFCLIKRSMFSMHMCILVSLSLINPIKTVCIVRSIIYTKISNYFLQKYYFTGTRYLYLTELLYSFLVRINNNRSYNLKLSLKNHNHRNSCTLNFSLLVY